MAVQTKNMSTRGLESIKGGDFRGFFAEKAHPDYPLGFIGRVTINDIPLTRAGNTKIKAPSDDSRNQFMIVDEIVGDFEDLQTSIVQKAHKYLNEIWWDWVEQGKVGGLLQLVVSLGTSPQNRQQYDSILALTNISLQGATLAGEKNPQETDGNEATTITADLNFWRLVRILRLKFGEVASAAVVREALDCDWRLSENGYIFYALLKNDTGTSPSALVVYNSTLGTTVSFNISALTTSNAERLAVVGDYLVITCTSGNSHLVCPISDAERGVDSFVVVTGYTALKTPNDLYPISSADVVVCAQGGYLYRLTGVNIAPTIIDAGVVTTQNLTRVAGYGYEVVAVGASNTVVYSADDGQTFALQVGPAVGIALTAVAFQGENCWFIGCANGKVFYTSNAGSSYTEISMPETLTSVQSIDFSEDKICCVITGIKSSVGYVYRSTDCGRTFRRTAPDISDLPTATRYNQVVSPTPNQVFVAGTDAAGTGGNVAYGRGLPSR